MTLIRLQMNCRPRSSTPSVRFSTFIWGPSAVGFRAGAAVPSWIARDESAMTQVDPTGSSEPPNKLISNLKKADVRDSRCQRRITAL